MKDLSPSLDNIVLDDSPLYNLNRTSATYIEEMSSGLKSANMDQTQWRVLAILGDKDNSTVSDIARRGVIKISTLTRMLKRMERDQLVQRKPKADDKRIVQVKITAKGKKALETAIAINKKVSQRAYEGISQQEIDQFTLLLKRIRTNFTHNRYLDRTE